MLFLLQNKCNFSVGLWSVDSGPQAAFQDNEVIQVGFVAVRSDIMLDISTTFKHPKSYQRKKVGVEKSIINKNYDNHKAENAKGHLTQDFLTNLGLSVEFQF